MENTVVIYKYDTNIFPDIDKKTYTQNKWVRNVGWVSVPVALSYTTTVRMKYNNEWWLWWVVQRVNNGILQPINTKDEQMLNERIIHEAHNIINYGKPTELFSMNGERLIYKDKNQFDEPTRIEYTITQLNK